MTPRLGHATPALCCALALCSLACAEGERERGDVSLPSAGVQDPEPASIELGVESARVTDLSGVFPEGSQLVGVAVDELGERYVLEQRAGLYRLPEGGAPQQILDATDLERRYGASAGLLLTDVVAYGGGQFLITAENDGFLFDPKADNFSSYFCYLPPSVPEPTTAPLSVSQELGRQGVPVVQRTNSVAFNRSTGEIFAQPQTFRLDRTSDGLAGSEVFVFGSSGGQPVQVFPIADLDFSAGGMVAAGERLLLGSGNALYELAGSTATLQQALDGDVDISGLAIDGDRHLLVLDGPRRRLLDYEIQF